MKDLELANLLQEWFNKNISNQNKWNNNDVGRILKKNLLKIGNWKNKKRGKPFRNY